jgi:hypothetical protein
MNLHGEAGSLTSALHHARKACRRERRPPLAGEHEWRLGILLPLQLRRAPRDRYARPREAGSGVTQAKRDERNSAEVGTPPEPYGFRAAPTWMELATDIRKY